MKENPRIANMTRKARKVRQYTYAPAAYVCPQPRPHLRLAAVTATQELNSARSQAYVGVKFSTLQFSHANKEQKQTSVESWLRSRATLTFPNVAKSTLATTNISMGITTTKPLMASHTVVTQRQKTHNAHSATGRDIRAKKSTRADGSGSILCTLCTEHAFLQGRVLQRMDTSKYY